MRNRQDPFPRQVTHKWKYSYNYRSSPQGAKDLNHASSPKASALPTSGPELAQRPLSNHSKSPQDPMPPISRLAPAPELLGPASQLPQDTQAQIQLFWALAPMDQWAETSFWTPRQVARYQWQTASAQGRARNPIRSGTSPT